MLASQYRHINAGDCGAAYDLFGDRSQGLISQGRYEAYFASNAPYEITSYSFSSVQCEGDTACVVADLTATSASGEVAYRRITDLNIARDSSGPSRSASTSKAQ